MQPHTLARITVCLIAIGLAAGRAPAQDQKQPEADPAQLQKLIEEYAQPGPQHKQLRRLVGKWDLAIKSYFPDPDSPSESKGSAAFRMLMGGRYVQQNVTGEYEGEKFRGMGLLGYDNAAKKYVGVWIDSMGTGIFHSEGTYDEKTQTLTETGESSSPIGPMKLKTVSRYLSDDKFTYTMYLLTGGGEQKMMEITYTRAEK